MIGQVVGISLGIKLINGKIKPKYNVLGIIVSYIVIPLIILGFTCALIYGLINLNFEFIMMPSIAIAAFIYMLLISPYYQSSKNYYIVFRNENSLDGFELFYKNKKVIVYYKLAADGKIAFADNNNKLNCISYEDGTKMGNFTKYKIINYFSKWLASNNLLSNEVTTTFEKL